MKPGIQIFRSLNPIRAFGRFLEWRRVGIAKSNSVKFALADLPAFERGLKVLTEVSLKSYLELTQAKPQLSGDEEQRRERLRLSLGRDFSAMAERISSAKDALNDEMAQLNEKMRHGRSVNTGELKRKTGAFARLGELQHEIRELIKTHKI